jgi:hypothetical protein
MLAYFQVERRRLRKGKDRSILSVNAEEWRVFSKDDINMWDSLKLVILPSRMTPTVDNLEMSITLK